MDDSRSIPDKTSKEKEDDDDENSLEFIAIEEMTMIVINEKIVY